MTHSDLAVHLFAAVGFGLALAGLYRWARPPGRGLPGLAKTLLLLTPLITMVTLGVGENMATAFTLVGTLAIVRFRTSIRDPQDTAYVIFAVALGVAVGNDHMAVAGLGGVILAGLVAALTLVERGSNLDSERRELVLVLASSDPTTVPWERLVTEQRGRATIQSTAIEGKSRALTLSIAVDGLDAARSDALVRALLTFPEVRSALCQPLRD